MPLPIAPIAGFAVRYGMIAIAAWTVVRRIERMPLDQRAEDAMDDMPEGLHLRRDKDATAGAARFRRVLRFGRTGPGVEIDLTTLGRVRFRRV